MQNPHSRPTAAALLTAVLFSTLVAGRGAAAEEQPLLPRDQRAILAADPRVDLAVVDQLAAAGAARVVVLFDVRADADAPPLRRFTGAEERALLRDVGDAIVLTAGPHLLVHRRYESVAALAGAIDAEGALRLLAHPVVRSVAQDLAVSVQLEEAVPLVGADALPGLRGKGVVVAVLDSGIDFTHKALKKARKAEQCFCQGCCPNGQSVQSGPGSSIDENGHGTHVAGIVASRGKAGAPKGAARKAKIVAVRILDSAGGGFASDTLAGLDWVLSSRPEVDLVNLSVGTDLLFRKHCDDKGQGLGEAFALLIGALRDRGTLTIAAAGNDGSRRKSIMPGCIRDALSVGASYDRQYQSVTYSSCADLLPGPGDVTCFSNRPKQIDLMAPGSVIRSAALGGGATDRAGTSQAAPLVAGCAALLIGGFPEASVDAVEAALLSTDEEVEDSKGRRFPRLDCVDAAAHLAAQEN